MYFKGKKLEEITEPQIFDPPRQMIVWDKETSTPFIKTVFAITARTYSPVVAENTNFNHCAEIPEEPKLATFLELIQWLQKGNGILRHDANNTICLSYLCCDLGRENEPVPPSYVVRKWGDTEWHEPTRVYLELEQK